MMRFIGNLYVETAFSFPHLYVKCTSNAIIIYTRCVNNILKIQKCLTTRVLTQNLFAMFKIVSPQLLIQLGWVVCASAPGRPM